MRRVELTKDGLKVCGRCKVPQTLFSFYKSSQSPDGARSICKNCDNLAYHSSDIFIRQEVRKARYERNKEKEKKNSLDYHASRMKTDPAFKMLRTVRHRHSSAVKSAGAFKNFRSTDLLGCTSTELKEHIEKQFTDNMNWDNHGSVWHVDHIYPLSLVDWEDAEQVTKVCHFSNLRPMIAVDNLRKGNKIEY